MSDLALHGRNARVSQRSLRVFLAAVGASEKLGLLRSWASVLRPPGVVAPSGESLKPAEWLTLAGTTPERAPATRQRRCAPAPGAAFGFSLALRPWSARSDVYGSHAPTTRQATLRPKTSDPARPDWQEAPRRSLPGTSTPVPPAVEGSPASRDVPLLTFSDSSATAEFCTPGPVNVKGGNPRTERPGVSEGPPGLPGNSPLTTRFWSPILLTGWLNQTVGWSPDAVTA
jgi:hypothetical protein